jgi:hypothetical protein
MLKKSVHCTRARASRSNEKMYHRYNLNGPWQWHPQGLQSSRHQRSVSPTAVQLILQLTCRCSPTSPSLPCSPLLCLVTLLMLLCPMSTKLVDCVLYWHTLFISGPTAGPTVPQSALSAREPTDRGFSIPIFWGGTLHIIKRDFACSGRTRTVDTISSTTKDNLKGVSDFGCR